MKYSLAVCLIALTFAAVIPCASAQSPELRKGVSVQMVDTTNASPMPAADNNDAWVIAVAADGRLYFGADPMTPDELADWMKAHPRNREAKLYIKADARAPFADVEKALEIGRVDGFDTPVLLTSQPESPAPGVMVPPKGLEVLVSAPPNASSIVVQISAGESMLKVNDEGVSPSALQGKLQKLLQNRNEHAVAVKAEGSVLFSHVAHVIDICSSVGARTVIPTPEL